MSRTSSIRHQNRQKLRQLIAQNTNEFCQNTTLHGLKYITSKDLQPAERWFFGLAVVTVLLGSAYFVFAIYDKWEHTPVIVGLNPMPAFIMKEAFPAVTICNSNLAVRSRALKLPKSSAEHSMLQYLCKQDLNTSTAKSDDIMTNWNHLENFILNISQPCHQMTLSCQFSSIDINCAEAFYPVLTDEGVCCVFNMLHPDHMYTASGVPSWLRNSSTTNSAGFEAVDWNAESGYLSKLPPKFFPRRTLGPGVTLGVNFVLNVQSHEYYCSTSNFIGFKILVHAPNEAPSMREAGILIEPGKETKVRVRPDKSETDRKLRSMHPKYRRCLFRGEGKLQYYAHYTQRNCERECDAEQQIEYCGCRGFDMPNVNDHMPLCGSQDEDCVKAVRLRRNPTIKSCIDSCLSACFDVGFTSDVFAVRLNAQAFADLNPKLRNFNQSYLAENVAVLNTYFKEYSIRSQLKTEFIGTSDFLSSVGGLIGLFIGFSFISIAEVVYFAILRPGRAILKQHFGKTISKLDQSLPKAATLNVLAKVHGTNFQRVHPNNHSKLFYESRTVMDVKILPRKQRLAGLMLLQSLQNDKIQFIN